MFGDVLVPDDAVPVDDVRPGDARQSVRHLLGPAVLLGHLAVRVGEQLDIEVVAVAHLGYLLERFDHDRQDVDVVVAPEVVGHFAERL